MPPAVHPQGTAKLILLSRAAESFSSVSGPSFCHNFSTCRPSSISLLCRDRLTSGSVVSKENTGKGVPAIGASPYTHFVAIYSGPHCSYRRSPLESKQHALSLHPRNHMAASICLLSGGLPCSTSVSMRYNELRSSMIVGGYSYGVNSIKYYSRVNTKCTFGRESIHRSSGASAWTLGKLKSSENPGINSFRSLCVSSRSAGSVPDVSYDGLPQEEEDCSKISYELKAVDQRTLKLQSGSCYLPHPAKEASGGEDAHFICVDEQVIGVADGVGGWAEVGVNAGLYSRELMAYSVDAIKEEPKGSVNPSRVLEKAYSLTKAAGSSTACIIALTDQTSVTITGTSAGSAVSSLFLLHISRLLIHYAHLVVSNKGRFPVACNMMYTWTDGRSCEGVRRCLGEMRDERGWCFIGGCNFNDEKGIHAVNLGDSGFIVVRDGTTIFSSPVQQHDFNFTYQLGSSPGGDLPSSADVFIFPVALGDVIVAGSDGLFDNLFNNEIITIVSESVAKGLDPQGTAQSIAGFARERALDRKRHTPFSKAAQTAGYRFSGGKLDDLTVVVSYITISDF